MDREQILAALRALAAELCAAGQQADLYVVGGSAIVEAVLAG